MAKEQTVETQPEEPSASDILKALPKAIAEATIEIQNRHRLLEVPNPPKKSVFNPTGGPRPKLARRVYFCGHVEEEGSLTNEEIELYNKVRPGEYNGGQWKVTSRKNGAVEEIFIALPVADPDQRMALPHKLSLILQQIVSEHDAQRAAK